MGCRSCCVRCCVCAVLTQVLAVVCVLAIIPAAYITYEFVLKPWGEEQLVTANPRDDSCARCVGVNTAFPVSSGSRFSAAEVVLINHGGKVVSGIAVAGAAVGATTFLLSLASLLSGSSSGAPTDTGTTPSPAPSTTRSSNKGCLEALLVVSHGQFVTLLGSLNLRGAPLFFFEFCKQFAWTNLQIFPRVASFSAVSRRSRALLSAADIEGELNTVRGVQRYAQLVGVESGHLFYYTCFGV